MKEILRDQKELASLGFYPSQVPADTQYYMVPIPKTPPHFLNSYRLHETSGMWYWSASTLEGSWVPTQDSITDKEM